VTSGLVEAVENVLGRDDEPDDALRATVALLASQDGVAWAGIAFREEGEVVLGPEAGTPDPARRVRVPVAYDGSEVGELWVDGEAERSLLEQVAARVAPYVLIGWDTGGQGWEP
jgi:hypothetical protein